MPYKSGISRRAFLKSAGVAGLVLSCAGSITISNADAQSSYHNHSEMNELFRGRMFFTDIVEFETLSNASERIFPKDSLGPGAIDLAVPYFIDNQLAAGYGYNAREYTLGPFFTGHATQGYQSPMIKRNIFKQGILAINRESNKRFQKDFSDLNENQMDEILALFEAGKVDFDGVSSAYFFGILRAAVLAGVYADPIYTGNNDMKGWNLKEYPGAQMSYKSIIKDTKFQKISPVSLSSMQ